MQICWEITFHQILNTLNACKYKMCAVFTSLFMPHLHCCTCDTYIPVQIDTYIPVHVTPASLYMWYLHPCTSNTYIPVHIDKLTSSNSLHPSFLPFIWLTAGWIQVCSLAAKIVILSSQIYIIYYKTWHCI